jgi:predicted N-acetyltransferase YhbS
MNVIIRNEEEKDYFEVENVIREAFWNVYRPGCNEHLVTHNLRTNDAFIKELDYVIDKAGEIIGNIIYSKVKLISDCGNLNHFICFGPIGIRPDYQGTGLGQKLIEYSLEEAKKLGYTAVFITGNHKYYQCFGFESASKYGIYLDENSFFT